MTKLRIRRAGTGRRSPAHGDKCDQRIGLLARPGLGHRRGPRGGRADRVGDRGASLLLWSGLRGLLWGAAILLWPAGRLRPGRRGALWLLWQWRTGITATTTATGAAAPAAMGSAEDARGATPPVDRDRDGSALRQIRWNSRNLSFAAGPARKSSRTRPSCGLIGTAAHSRRCLPTEHGRAAGRQPDGEEHDEISDRRAGARRRSRVDRRQCHRRIGAVAPPSSNHGWGPGVGIAAGVAAGALIGSAVAARPLRLLRAGLLL